MSTETPTKPADVACQSCGTTERDRWFAHGFRVLFEAIQSIDPDHVPKRDQVTDALLDKVQEVIALRSTLAARDAEIARLKGVETAAQEVLNKRTWYMQVAHAEVPRDEAQASQASEDFEYTLVQLAAALARGEGSGG